MSVPPSRRSVCLRVGTGAISAAILSLAAAALLLPGRAAAGQSSPPGAVDEQLATGVYHSCAVRPDASLVCWGFSGDGQLGYGNTDTVGETNTPGSVGPVNFGGHTVRALAAGPYHTCAILDDGTVRCWGYGYYGALGYGASNDQGYPGSVPVYLGPLNGPPYTATAITAGGTPLGVGSGMHTCVILNTGGVECWGDNDYEGLGYQNPPTSYVGQSSTPGAVGPVNLGTDAAGNPATATAIAAGGQHTCAILDDGSVKCWGYGVFGELGYGTGSPDVPSNVGPVNLGTDPATGKAYTAAAITAGDYDTCVILNTGGVECWGDNADTSNTADGELGYGTSALTLGSTPTTTPDQNGTVDLGKDPNGQSYTAVAISAGATHTCAVLNNGSVECWGSGAYGQLGYGNTNSVGVTDTPGSVGPVDLGTDPSTGQPYTATAISVGTNDTCARLNTGGVQCWGLGADGELGHCSGANVGDTPTDTPNLVPPVDIGYGGAECPPAPPPATTTTTTTPTTPAPTPAPTPSGPSAYAAGVKSQALRAKGFRACDAGVARKERAARARTLRRYSHTSTRRTRLLRKIARTAKAGDARCVKEFGRVPARVTTLSASAGAGGTVALHFKAVSSNGSTPPAARSYVIRESRSPITTVGAFDRAAELCKGSCTFAVTQLATPITLNVTHLRAHVTYYYAIAARDNVSGRVGPRSAPVHATAT